VATTLATDGIDIVGAAQCVRIHETDPSTCEFAITVTDDWRGSGPKRQLLASLVRRARRDVYTRMEGAVIATNSKMLALVANTLRRPRMAGHGRYRSQEQ